MQENIVTRFAKINNNSVDEIDKFLSSEADRIKNKIDRGKPVKYADMLALSMFSDVYASKVSDDVHNSLVKRNGEDPAMIQIIYQYRTMENRMVGIANWCDTVQDVEDADKARAFAWDLIDNHHYKGYDVHLSMVAMEDGEPYECGILFARGSDENLDDFKADYLALLSSIFNEFSEETSLQLFFSKPGHPAEKAFILVNCLWYEVPDGYEECQAGPFITSGESNG